MRYKFWGQSDLSFLEYFSLRHLGKTLWISFRNFNWGAIQVNQSVHKSRDLEYSRCDSRSIKCFEFQYFRSSFREISTTYWIYVCRVTNIMTHNTINKAWVPSNYHQILIIIKNKKTQCSWVAFFTGKYFSIKAGYYDLYFSIEGYQSLSYIVSIWNGHNW